MRQAELDAGEREGLTTEELEGAQPLRRENRQLREDVDLEAGDSFLLKRPGEVHPFVEAKEVAGHDFKGVCKLLEVSRALFCQRLSGSPSARAVTNAALAERIAEIQDHGS